MKKPKTVDLDQGEIDTLIIRIQKCGLSNYDQSLIIELIKFNIWLQFSLKEAKISITRLMKLFGFTRKKKSFRKPTDRSSSSNKPKDSDGHESASDSSENPVKGHGRISHHAYTGADQVKVSHNKLKARDNCPLLCDGRLYNIEPGQLIRVTGSPIATAVHYEQEKLRCNSCGAIFSANLPRGVSPEDKYDESAKAVLALQKYFLGSPFHRIKDFQNLIGVPLPDSTIWDLVDELAGVIYPIFKHLIKMAANGDVIFNDDTGVKILSLLKENQLMDKQCKKKKRKGMYTTGILSHLKSDEGLPLQIALFFSSRKTAGENLDEVLSHRSELMDMIIQMSDALPASKPKKAKTKRCLCLSHAYRKFEEIENYWHEECEFVMKKMGKVFEHERWTKGLCMTPKERLDYHQTNSKPIMDELEPWFDEQIEEEIIDPNSSLGKAIQYCRNHWFEFTLFLRIENAPIHNNDLERALKIPARNRKNAFHYKSEYGALIGDIHMSIIYTCWLNKVNPLDYLIQLQYHRSDLLKAPQDFLPWNYLETIDSISNKAA